MSHTFFDKDGNLHVVEDDGTETIIESCHVNGRNVFVIIVSVYLAAVAILIGSMFYLGVFHD